MKTGHPIPERFQNPPFLNPNLQFFYDAFFDLTYDRTMGFGPGPIPLAAIFKYCEHYRIDRDVEEDLILYVRVMDMEYLKFVARKNKADGKSKKAK